MALKYVVGSVSQEALVMIQNHMDNFLGGSVEMLGGGAFRHSITKVLADADCMGIFLSMDEYATFQTFGVNSDVVFGISSIEDVKEIMRAHWGSLIEESDNFSEPMDIPVEEPNMSTMPTPPAYNPSYTQPMTPVPPMNTASTEEVSKLQAEIDRLKADITKAESRYNSVNAELMNTKGLYEEALRNPVVPEVDPADNELVRSLQNELEMLRTEGFVNAGKASQFDSLQASHLETTTELKDKVNIIRQKDSEISSLNEDLLITKGEIKKQQQEISNLEAQIEDVESSKGELETDIASLRDSLGQRDESLKKCEILMKRKVAKIKELEKRLEGNNEELQDKNKDLMVKVSNLQYLNETLNVQLEQLQIAQGERNDIDAQITQLHQQITELTGVLAEKDNLLASSEDEKNGLLTTINAKETELTKVMADLEITSGQVDGLKSELSTLRTTSNADSTEVLALREQLADTIREKGKADAGVAALTRELEEERVKTNNALTSMEDIKHQLSVFNVERANEVAQYQVQLAQIGSLQQEAGNVGVLRQHTQQVEQDLQVRNAQLKAMQDDLFYKLGASAVPLGAVANKVKVPRRLTPEKFFCVTSGSCESNALTMSCLRDSIRANNHLNYLILDLSADSRVDVDFGLEAVRSPRDWLLGKAPYTNFLARPKTMPIYNLCVLSTAFAYLNDTYLLKVDWESRLKELESCADIIIIHLGCLNNMVAKTMYNSFADIMRCHILVKATPLNLRSTALNIAGFKLIEVGGVKTLPTTTITCLEYDANTSRQWYEKLSKKCNIRTLDYNHAITL